MMVKVMIKLDDGERININMSEEQFKNFIATLNNATLMQITDGLAVRKDKIVYVRKME